MIAFLGASLGFEADIMKQGFYTCLFNVIDDRHRPDVFGL